MHIYTYIYIARCVCVTCVCVCDVCDVCARVEVEVLTRALVRWGRKKDG